jgi:uncharacterized protein YebE (UPF0316 family)
MPELITWLNSNPWFWPVFIFLARITDVSIGTMRTICVVRGYRTIAAAMGFCEVTIWLVAISGVLAHVDHLANILAYGAGFAAGNACGVALEQKLALGQQVIQFISRGYAQAVAHGLRLADYLVTEVPARGLHGQVALCFVVVPRRKSAAVMRIATRIDPDVLVTVEDVRHSTFSRPRFTEVTGWRAILKKK